MVDESWSVVGPMTMCEFDACDLRDLWMCDDVCGRW